MPQVEQVQQHQPQRKQIGAGGELQLAPGLLGGHVLRRAFGHTSHTGMQQITFRPGDAEVSQLGHSMPAQQHVGGLQISMDDVEGLSSPIHHLMRETQSFTHLSDELKHNGGGNTPLESLMAGQHFKEGGPFH